jgi:glycosyltransferase involved in cell wall biosynthesis
MKILHLVESYLPARNGMQEVVTQLSTRLVEKGHQVTVVTSYDEIRNFEIIDGVRVIGFKINGNYSLGVKGEIENFFSFLRENEFDIITNFAAQQWATDLVLPILNDLTSKKVFVPTGFSGFYNPSHKTYFKQMKEWIKEYDANVFLSNDYRDINFARENNAKNIVVIPNGADKDEFENNKVAKEEIFNKLNIPQDSFVILTVGSHTGLKGHNESMAIFKKLKVKNAVLCVVGNSQNLTLLYITKSIVKQLASPFIKRIKPDCYLTCQLESFLYNISIQSILQSKKIFNLNLSRTDTISLYKNADLFLFPSNIECSPIVLFECGAARLPFLTSDVGNSKEIISWTGGGELMKTIKDSNSNSHVQISDASTQLLDLYNNGAKRDVLSENAYNSHLRTYNWASITDKYEELYARLLK